MQNQPFNIYATSHTACLIAAIIVDVCLRWSLVFLNTYSLVAVGVSVL